MKIAKVLFASALAVASALGAFGDGRADDVSLASLDYRESVDHRIDILAQSAPPQVSSVPRSPLGIGGYQVTTYTLKTAKDTIRQWFTTVCPTGKKVIAGGCEPKSADWNLHASFPDASGLGWRCGFATFDRDGHPAADLVGHAVCAVVD